MKTMKKWVVEVDGTVEFVCRTRDEARDAAQRLRRQPWVKDRVLRPTSGYLGRGACRGQVRVYQAERPS